MFIACVDTTGVVLQLVIRVSYVRYELIVGKRAIISQQSYSSYAQL